jgi:hypothetical protein
MMTSNYYAFLLCCLSLFLSGCFTPREVIRIAPGQSENVFWYQGQAIAEAQMNNITTRAAYSHANRDYLIFDVEVFNDSDRPCLISPENLSLTTQQNVRIPAVDPETELFSLEMEASRREANAKKMAVAGGVVLATAAVVAAVSSDGDNAISNDFGDNYDLVDASLDLAEGATMVAWAINFHNDPVLSVSPDVLPEAGSVAFWQDVALRRTTIMPNSNIRGLVAFPRTATTTGNLILDIPLQCAHFSFNFTQKTFQP